jgi:hypothetical protein
VLCAAPATGIRQQILRARSSAAFFFNFLFLPFFTTFWFEGNKKNKKDLGSLNQKTFLFSGCFSS